MWALPPLWVCAFINLVETSRFRTKCRFSSSEIAPLNVDFPDPVPLVVVRRLDVVAHMISPANLRGEASAPANEVSDPMTWNDDAWLLSF